MQVMCVMMCVVGANCERITVERVFRLKRPWQDVAEIVMGERLCSHTMREGPDIVRVLYRAKEGYCVGTATIASRGDISQVVTTTEVWRVYEGTDVAGFCIVRVRISANVRLARLRIFRSVTRRVARGKLAAEVDAIQSIIETESDNIIGPPLTAEPLDIVLPQDPVKSGVTECLNYQQ